MKTPLMLLAAVSLVPLGSAQISKQSAGYLFRNKYTAGQTNKFLMSLVSTAGGQTLLKMETPLVMKTKSVSKGIATLDVATGPAKMNGQSQGKVDRQTVKMDTRNRPVGGSSNFESFGTFAFPEKAIKPGSTWKQKIDMASAVGNIKLDAVYTFVGVKTVGGKSVAEIRTTMKGNMMGPITGTATSFLRVADGSVDSSAVKLIMNVTAGEGQTPQKVVSDVKVIRQ